MLSTGGCKQGLASGQVNGHEVQPVTWFRIVSCLNGLQTGVTDRRGRQTSVHVSVPLVIAISQLSIGGNTTSLAGAVTDRRVHLQHALGFASGITKAVVDYPADLTQVFGVVNLSFSN